MYKYPKKVNAKQKKKNNVLAAWSSLHTNEVFHCYSNSRCVSTSDGTQAFHLHSFGLESFQTRLIKNLDSMQATGPDNIPVVP